MNKKSIELIIGILTIISYVISIYEKSKLIAILTTIFVFLVLLIYFFVSWKVSEKVIERLKNDLQKKESNNRTQPKIEQLLQEQEKRVRMEEELKITNQLCSSYQKDAEEHYKENEKIKNKIGQLKYILMWHGFKQEKADKITDGSVLAFKGEERPKIKRVKKEILDKRFKCEKCDKCNQKNSD